MDLLFDCLQKGTSPVHTVAFAKEYLKAAGFEELHYDGLFYPQLGRRYYITPYPDVLFAFTMGEKRKYSQSVRMAFAHVDQPCFTLKGKADVKSMECTQLNVEVYGGMVDHTWFDRPLGLSGTVTLRGEDAFHPVERMYDSGRPIAIIPGLAIHMNRRMNEGWKIDRQKELLPVTGLAGEHWSRHDLLDFLAGELSVEKEDILVYNLNLYHYAEPMLLGMENELISSPRLDNLVSVSALLESLVEADRKGGMNLIGLFNNEEVGSESRSGADSMLLYEVLRQIFHAISCTDDMVRASMAQSFYLSVDGAHGAHPNYPECADPTTRAYLGKGAVVKRSSVGKYCSDSTVIAILKELAAEHEIAIQEIGDRNTIRGGMTIGSMVGAHILARGCDIGAPMWSMHSSLETMASEDYDSLCSLITAFFSD